MNITKFDITIIACMSLSVVAMSFVFPALGLADTQTSENEIPELQMNSSQFDFAGDFPAAPGSPSEVDLKYTESQSLNPNQVWLEGDTSGGVEVVLLPPGAGDPTQILINDWNAGNASEVVRINFTAAGETEYYTNESLGYELRFESLTIDETAGEYVVRMTIQSQVVDSGWLSNVPVLGSAVEAGQATAAVVGWFVEILVWAFVFVFELIANALGAVSSVMIYLISLLTWLSTTYAAVVTAAPSWTKLFVSIPAILLTYSLSKVIIIGVKMLPYT